ncbi:MAG: alpha/beta fold hydrolase [Dermatophilaceae bacterium]
MTVTTHVHTGYDDLGTGEPTVLFMPGWCGDRTAFDPLLPLVATHRRAVAMDLRDHGGSTRTAEDFTADTVIEDALELVARLGLGQVVPVGLSHAGWMAIELRRRLGAQRVPALVLLDWMVLGPPPGFLDALGGLQEESSWEQVRSALFGMWTSGVDVPAVHEYVARMGEYGTRHWRRAGREIARTFATEGSPLSALERLDVACPTLHLYAQPADPAVLAAQQQYAVGHPWFHVQRLDAHSHFPMFEVPQQIASAIERFVCPTP